MSIVVWNFRGKSSMIEDSSETREKPQAQTRTNRAVGHLPHPFDLISIKTIQIVKFHNYTKGT